MAYREYEGQCGTCREFDANGRSKGYCRKYGCYQWPSDTCAKYEDKDGVSGSFCFLTTACCEYKGLPDDCYELEELRKMRDIELKKDRRGVEIIDFYYKEAPRIVKQIENSNNKDEVCDWIYNCIHNVISTYHSGRINEAIVDYLFMMYKVDLMTRDGNRDYLDAYIV